MVSVIPKPDLLTLEAEYDNLPRRDRHDWLLLQLVKQLIKQTQELDRLNTNIEHGISVYTGSL